MNTTQTMTPYLLDALQVITAARQRYPDSRNLALHQAELLAECGRAAEALSACEQFLVQFGVDDQILAKGLELRRQAGKQPFLPKVSLCMIVKNEERYLAQCLASVAPVVDEMIVVDTGSTDRTIAIATLFGAEIHHFTWNGSFSDARNHAISKASGRWILIMDADEALSSRDHEAFRHLISDPSSTKTAWSVPIRNYSHRAHIQGWSANDGSYPELEQADGWYPAERVRLFPRDERISYQGIVHELVEPALRANGFIIRTAPIIAHHYGEVDGLPDNLRDKQLHYYELGKQKLESNRNDLVALAELAVQAGELERFEEALQLWDRLLMLRPDTVEALFGKGHALINLKRYGEALEVSRRALQLDPSHREAAFNYGTCELYAGDPARALAVVERLLGEDQHHPQLQALSILLHLACGHPDQANTAYRFLTAHNYDCREYLRARMATLASLKRHDITAMIRTTAATSGIIPL